MMFKRVLSLIICIMLFFCSFVTAFAEGEPSNKFGDEYAYGGELIEGLNEVWKESWETGEIEDFYVYYTFTMPTDGYYHLSYGTPHTDITVEIPDEYEYIETFYDYYIYDRIYFLEKGEYRLNIDVLSSYVDVNVYSEYLGESISDISFDYDQVMNCDFDWYRRGSSEAIAFESTADATITFSSGKTFKFENGTLYGTLDSEYADGINKMKIDFLGKSFSTTATVYQVSNYISDVEISNLEDYYDKNIEYFNYLDYTLPYGETIKFTFTDGSTQYIDCDKYMYITLPNGQSYEIDIYIFYNKYFSCFHEGDCYLKIEMGHETIKTHYFDGTKVSFKENMDSYNEQTKSCRDELIYNIKMVAKYFGDSKERFYYLEECINSVLQISMISFDYFFYFATFSFA